MNIINIDFKTSYTFGQVLDEITEDSTSSFTSNGVLYFKKGNKFRTCKLNINCMSGVSHAKELDITNELFEQTYYKTDIYISNLVTQIEYSEVKDNLIKGNIVMLTLDKNTWILELEDDVVYLDYSQVEEATDDNYLELYARDSLMGIVNGMYHIIEEYNNQID